MSMTTPRVTVPVDMNCPKCGARSGDDWEQCGGRCPMPGSPHYSAAPAPEGGVVERACVDFQRAIDDFEADVADVMAEGSERADLWDREIMVNIDALKTVMSAALATREEAPTDHVSDARQMVEAPAEAGERERLISIIAARPWSFSRDAVAAKADAILALRAQPQAREDDGGTLDPAFVDWLKERDCLPNDDDGTIEWADIVCALNDWEADLTQAREDAQPVVKVVSAHGDPEAFGEREIEVLQDLSRIPYNTPLYTHPAPDALREAVEALSDLIENAVAARGCGLKNDPDGIVSSALFDTIMNGRQALAALQAEQEAKQ